MIKDPGQTIHDTVIGSVSSLDDHPFVCVSCGEEFECINDVIDHLLTRHEYILVKHNRRAMTFNSFMDMMGKEMADSLRMAGLDEQEI